MTAYRDEVASRRPIQDLVGLAQRGACVSIDATHYPVEELETLLRETRATWSRVPAKITLRGTGHLATADLRRLLDASATRGLGAIPQFRITFEE